MIIDNITVFDGSLFKKRFAYSIFGYSRTLRIGNIVSFVGPLNFRVEDTYVTGEQCINFCIELPEYDNLSGSLFQKLFLTNVAQILSTNYLKVPVEISRYELIVQKEHNNGGIIQKNGIVSNTYMKNVNGAMLIYLGLYNKTGEGANARAFAMNLNKEQSIKLMEEINQSFYFLTNDVFLNSCTSL